MFQIILFFLLLHYFFLHIIYNFQDYEHTRLHGEGDRYIWLITQLFLSQNFQINISSSCHFPVSIKDVQFFHHN